MIFHKVGVVELLKMERKIIQGEEMRERERKR